MASCSKDNTRARIILFAVIGVMMSRRKNNDREFHYRYVRMSKERFDYLLSLVREKVTKKDTCLRDGITAEERLVITLRHL